MVNAQSSCPLKDLPVLLPDADPHEGGRRVCSSYVLGYSTGTVLVNGQFRPLRHMKTCCILPSLVSCCPRCTLQTHAGICSSPELPVSHAVSCLSMSTIGHAHSKCYGLIMNKIKSLPSRSWHWEAGQGDRCTSSLQWGTLDHVRMGAWERVRGLF